MPALVVSLLAALLIAWLLGEPLVTARRRKTLRARPFPAAWRDILRRRVPHARALPTDLQRRLKQHIQVFLSEKAFIGCNGLEITDEIRVTIAAQACLLLINRPANYFPELRQVLVYPGSFVVDRSHTDGVGVAHHRRQALSGESWGTGQVILSWQDTLEGAAIADDGQNVVIHEFAHQLDQETGAANGAPFLRRKEHYRRWSLVLGAEFEALQASALADERSLFSDYGATDPAEFFAVVCEVFFEQPSRMAQAHPALYRELVQFFRLDPANW